MKAVAKRVSEKRGVGNMAGWFRLLVTLIGLVIGMQLTAAAPVDEEIKQEYALQSVGQQEIADFFNTRGFPPGLINVITDYYTDAWLNRRSKAVWRELCPASAKRVKAIALSFDDQFAVIGFYDNSLQLIHVATGEVLHEREADGSLMFDGLKFTPDNRYVKIHLNANKERLWDVASGAYSNDPAQWVGMAGVVSDSLWNAAMQNVSPLCSAVSRDGSLFVVGYADGEASVWSTKTGSQRALLRGHTGNVYAIAVSENNALLVTGCEDKTARVWDCDTGQCKHILAHTGEVFCRRY